MPRVSAHSNPLGYGSPMDDDLFKVASRISNYACTVLNLSNLNIWKLPPNLCLACPNLEELNLSGNNVRHLPDGLSSLKVLNWSSNGFTEWPSGLEGLPNLETLDLSNNPLSQLSSVGILGLPSLTTLNLSDTQVDMGNGTYIDNFKEILCHPKLETFSFSSDVFKYRFPTKVKDLKAHYCLDQNNRPLER